MCISCVLTLAVKLSLNSVLYNGLVQLVPVLYAVNLFQIKINDLDAVSSRKPPIFHSIWLSALEDKVVLTIVASKVS
jgi:hypothetical protein